MGFGLVEGVEDMSEELRSLGRVVCYFLFVIYSVVSLFV